MSLAAERDDLTAHHAMLAYDTSRWQRFLFDSRLRTSSQLSGAVSTLAKAIEDAHPAYDHEAHTGLRRFARDTADAMAGEVFARLYADPKPLEGVGCPYFIREAHDNLEVGLEPLRSRTAGDPDMSALGAARLLEAIAKQVRVLVDEERVQADGEAQEPDGAPTAGERVRAAIRGAGDKAALEASDVAVALAGLGHGLDAAPPAHMQADTDRMEIADLIASNPAVASILRRAGRITRIADAKQRQDSPDARSEVVAIERGADLSRILPSELAGLNHPLLRKLALRSLIEESCLQYRLAGKEPLGRGPMVVLVDRSTSMWGAPHELASAAAIAAVVRCIREKRACTVVGFNGSIESVLRVDEKGDAYTADYNSYTGAIRGWTSIGNGGNLILEIARSAPSGGTDFNRPLAMAARDLLECERADVLFITDGHATATDTTLSMLQEAREERGMRVFGLTVNGGRIGGAVKAICDEVEDLDSAIDSDRAVAGIL